MSQAEDVPVSSELRVLHVIPSLSPKDGGPTFAVISLIRALSSSKVGLTILTTRQSAERDDSTATEDLAGKIAEVIYSERSLRFYKISWSLLRWLVFNLNRFDLAHVHALFSFSSVVAGLMARWQKIPYIVRPLGVLNRWGMEKRRPLMKRLSYWLIDSRILRTASAIHFTSQSEADEAYQFDSHLRTVPAIILPLPVVAPVAADKSHPFINRFPQLAQVQSILFLSRFHQKKGIELLMEAFASLSAEIPECVLVLAGDGEKRYVRSLQARAAELGIEKRVLWPGFLSGAEKSDALSSASIFVLPSYSENFGIAAAEALAAGKACILSDQVGLAFDANRAKAAVVTQCNVEQLAAAIKALLSDPIRRDELGNNAEKFVSNNLSMRAIGSQLEEIYQNIVDDSAKKWRPSAP